MIDGDSDPIVKFAQVVIGLDVARAVVFPWRQAARDMLRRKLRAQPRVIRVEVDDRFITVRGLLGGDAAVRHGLRARQLRKDREKFMGAWRW